MTLHPLTSKRGCICIKFRVSLQKRASRWLALFLSKPQAWYIITRQRVYHRRRRISSAEGCIPCGLMRCNPSCWWYAVSAKRMIYADSVGNVERHGVTFLAIASVDETSRYQTHQKTRSKLPFAPTPTASAIKGLQKRYSHRKTLILSGFFLFL